MDHLRAMEGIPLRVAPVEVHHQAYPYFCLALKDQLVLECDQNEKHVLPLDPQQLA